MGIDLKIYIDHYPQMSLKEAWIFDSINLDRNYELFEMISPEFGKHGYGEQGAGAVMQPQKLEKPIKVHTDNGIRKKTKDAYGTPLTFVTPSDFKKIPASYFKMRAEGAKKDKMDWHKWNNAILKMLANLPKKTQLVLYWC